LTSLFTLPSLTFTDWTDAFAYLSRYLTNKPTVILFDEISWMGSKDPTFISKLKIWWDLILQKHPSVVLILCGSISTWIDKNIIHSTAFFGRVSLYLELSELTIPQCRQLLNLQGFKGSDLYCGRDETLNFCGHQSSSSLSDRSSARLPEYRPPHDRLNLNNSEDHQNSMFHPDRSIMQAFAISWELSSEDK
ncbi:MAG TPA: hypothetical protein VHA52_13820, partial [Candidatus Babeliaceae bacterium]|nr:hypothetical protein [Candidatus Babeliaceae bacterium]